MSLEDGTQASLSGHTEGQEETAQTTSSGDHGGSTHAKQKIGLFKAEAMRKCIAEIHKVEADAKRHGIWPTSQNKICKEFGLSPSMVSKRISSDIPLSFFSLEEMSSWASFSPPQKIHHKTL